MRSSLFLALAAVVPAAVAVFSQGTINITRDYEIQYSGYASTEDFCHSFRTACVAYAGSIDHHHQLDCVFAQPGPVIRAFCGGIQKTAAGSWTSGETIEPFTSTMITWIKGASIVGNPVVPAVKTTSHAASTSPKTTSAPKSTSTSHKSTSVSHKSTSAHKVTSSSKSAAKSAVTSKAVVKKLSTRHKRSAAGQQAI